MLYLNIITVNSTVGMDPSSNTKVSSIATIEEPNSMKYYARQTAVPAARRLFSDLFSIMNISPYDANDKINKNATKKN
ncbi:hypothetical protein K2F40_06400 [Clostridium sp. CM028]|uniref:hypothetical protein n=1 Tax=unclassified Clostridium TaxID=2614128 RepID=UPI001C0C4149|nr:MULTISPECIES: hypothetical protein [unclassified Clostridium]MBU3091003.1 hypothetical protein [Clostridium sp. CF011]MBW9148593.1 hypothetical protein [Clostridium sp. CM028]WLC60811.1 hypothetical protein KTC94_11760 [Clostridium sp. CM028]